MHDLDAMVKAFSRVIEAHHSGTHPFHNPIDADAKIALRTLRGLIPGMKVCAHPPCDEWRPASEPPDSTRSVLIWLKFGDVETFGKTLGGPSGFAFQNGAITHWRDVNPPPTEGE